VFLTLARCSNQWSRNMINPDQFSAKLTLLTVGHSYGRLRVRLFVLCRLLCSVCIVAKCYAGLPLLCKKSKYGCPTGNTVKLSTPICSSKIGVPKPSVSPQKCMLSGSIGLYVSWAYPSDSWASCYLWLAMSFVIRQCTCDWERLRHKSRLGARDTIMYEQCCACAADSYMYEWAHLATRLQKYV